MEAKYLPRISFGLSLFTPFIFLLVIFGMRSFSGFLMLVMILSLVSAIVLAIVSLTKISRKKIEGGVGFSIVALVLGVLFLIIWILGYMFAVASMPVGF